MMKYISFIIIVCLLHETFCVDKNNFKTCDQSSFCRRCRKLQPGNSQFHFVRGSLRHHTTKVTADIINQENEHLFSFKLEAVKDNMFNIVIDELSPLKPRYRVTDAIDGKLEFETITIDESNDEQLIVISGKNKAVIYANPLKIDFYHDNVLYVSANAKGLMRFEHLRKKPTDGQDPQENADNPDVPVKQTKSIEDDDPGSWEENFKSHHDSKPNGPEAVAMDFSFPQAQILFGIPEHADSFALRSTISGEPYRLYNLDVFEYELDNGMALYGSVPVLYGHGVGGTSGIYWQNAAETWVDIYNPDSEKNVLSSIVNMVSGSGQTDPLAANFMSESGIIDVFILLGPTPNAVFRQYTDLTGVTPLPQMFSLGYHQCRWNYNDEQDVDGVAHKFDEHDIPMDTMWLDIEYTDSKKYFTWDQHKFPNSLEMIKNLTNLGRHLIIIIDPHIKRDNNYFFHNDCTDKGYYTKNKDGNDYEGWCWPGSSSYPDLFNPEVQKYFADQYLLENFKTTTADVMIWNDMNEPSVFNGPEVTMLKDNVHYGGWEHRHVHNLYAYKHVQATFDGLGRRDNWRQRPFILTRGHFSGTQRIAAIWTGDNFAEWSHLQATIKMCLAESVAGFSFCGADIGGFFGNPDAELLARWYQTGAFQPFYRAHAHIDTKRREPWLYPESTKLVIRDALRKRYSYLPFWYTMFYEHERYGLPIMRPMLSEYPKDKQSFAMDNQYLLSDKLLVHPVMTQGVSNVNVYFPVKDVKNGSGDIWYDIDNYNPYKRAGFESIPVDSYKIPVYQRGGTIVPKKERIRRSATRMHNDPYTLIVCLDSNGYAKGTLYIDDEKSYDYHNGKYIYLGFEFSNNQLISKNIDGTVYETKTWLERVVVTGLNRSPKDATVKLDHEKYNVDVEKHENSFIIRKPGVSMITNWSIELNY